MRKIGLILVSVIASLEIGCSIYAADADIQYNEVIDEKENEEENIIEKGYDPAINANAYYERSTVKKNGWNLESEIWYYYNENGERKTGWLKYNNNWYYLDDENTENPGAMVCDSERNINGVRYYFGSDGIMKTGWILSPEGWYYANGSGAIVTGWQLIGGQWYYLDGNNATYPGLMVANQKYTVNGIQYSFSGSGAMQTGWMLSPEGWYYANGSGAIVTGWQLIGGQWYYLDGNNTTYPGVMVANQKYIVNGIQYSFSGSGAMQTGWILSPEGWYYANGSGAIVTGWQLIANNWYYFYKANDPNTIESKEAIMATNTEIDGWTISSSGVAIQSIEKKIAEIKKYVGTPYRYGGATPNGWDCSGFTQWALKYLGLSIPRSSYEQAKGGIAINKKDKSLWKSGDILLYANPSGSVNHVALYLGDGMLMHALNSKYGTLIQGVDYYESWDKGNSLVGVRRYL